MQFSVPVCLCLLLGVAIITAAPSELSLEEQKVAASSEFSLEEQGTAAQSQFSSEEQDNDAAPSQFSSEEQDNDDEGTNLPRVTCDLLSFSVSGFSVNHSACAAHCILRRKRGGRCINGVCSCRK
uniref:Invertebrate defensins family profile domain-containing protein n=1 Tax=Cuerna arida TaxID=1464854 RepID=A0A1B6FU29_9HEMI